MKSLPRPHNAVVIGSPNQVPLRSDPGCRRPRQTERPL